MKTIIALTLLAVSLSTFAASSYGVVSTRHYTTRKNNTVCAIDVVTLTSGKVLTEKSCFKI